MNSECFLILNRREQLEGGITVEDLGTVLARKRNMILKGHTVQTKPGYFDLLHKNTSSETRSCFT